jgi:hypothetical protein
MGVGCLATIGLLALLLPGVAIAQERTSSRTPWGDPDLQGVWTSEMLRDAGVPYERPKQFGDRLYLTDEEFAQRQARAARFGFVNNSKTFRQTSLIVDPPDGRYPALTPEALKRPRPTSIGTYGNGPFDGPEDLTLYDRCLTRGVVASILPVAYGNALQIFQIPGQVVIRYEMIHETRVIPLDGRPRIGQNIRQYMGDARGHWEGDTLVVETTNLSDKTSVGRNGYGPKHTEALRLVERFTRVGDGQIDYEATANDPRTWTRPFTFRFPLTSQANYTELLPYECHEGGNSYNVMNVLAGARARERAAAEAQRNGTTLLPEPPPDPLLDGVQRLQEDTRPAPSGPGRNRNDRLDAWLVPGTWARVRRGRWEPSHDWCWASSPSWPRRLRARHKGSGRLPASFVTGPAGWWLVCR